MQVGLSFLSLSSTHSYVTLM